MREIKGWVTNICKRDEVEYTEEHGCHLCKQRQVDGHIIIETEYDLVSRGVMPDYHWLCVDMFGEEGGFPALLRINEDLKLIEDEEYDKFVKETR